MIKLLLAVLFLSASAQANDSCPLIVKRVVQASFPSQEEYSVTSEPKKILETDPHDGVQVYDTWRVMANERSEEGGFATTVVTSRRPNQSLNEGCSVVGIF